MWQLEGKASDQILSVRVQGNQIIVVVNSLGRITEQLLLLSVLCLNHTTLRPT